MAFEIFSHPIQRKYKSSICSKATVFYIVTTLLSFIPAFLIAYRSQGFWQKTSFYREQPDVHFKHKMLLLLETNQPDHLIVWSTFPKLNQMLINSLKIPVIESNEEDSDRDNRNDKLLMNIEIPFDHEEIVSVKLILFFDYKLYLYSSFHMECLAYIQHSSPLPGSSLTVSGELALHQREPLRHRGKDTRYNQPIIDESENNVDIYTLERIFSSYSSRNVTTDLKYSYPVWRSGRGKEPFKINLSIIYPEETVLYRVGFWQLIKWAWVQYAVILAVFLYISQYIKAYVFENQLISTSVYCPLQRRS